MHAAHISLIIESQFEISSTQYFIFYAISTDNPICPFSIWLPYLNMTANKSPIFHFIRTSTFHNIIIISWKEGTKKRLITQWTGHFLRRAEWETERRKMFNQKSRFIFCWLIWFRYVSAYFFFILLFHSIAFFVCFFMYSYIFGFILFYILFRDTHSKHEHSLLCQDQMYIHQFVDL